MLDQSLGGGRRGRLHAACDLPLASATAWRASAIDGSVSPIGVEQPEQQAPRRDRAVDQPGRLHRRREHLAGRAGQQRAVEIEERCTPVPVVSGWPSARLYAKTGETPLGGSGVSQPEPCDWGNHIGGFFRTEPIGGGYRSTTCESMHVNE